MGWTPRVKQVFFATKNSSTRLENIYGQEKLTKKRSPMVAMMVLSYGPLLMPKIIRQATSSGYVFMRVFQIQVATMIDVANR